MKDQTHRSVQVTRLGPGRWRATNPRGGEMEFGSGDSDAFTPVELLLAAIGGCSAAGSFCVDPAPPQSAPPPIRSPCG